MSAILPLYWHLASHSKSERLDASSKLVSELLAYQDSFAASPAEEGDEDDEESEEDDERSDMVGGSDGAGDGEPEPSTSGAPDLSAHESRLAKQEASVEKALDRKVAPDVSYAIRRLLRGLASPRESSRLGFAVTLTELLSRLTEISALEILVLLFKFSRPQGSVKGQEERDLLFARLFGIQALVHSALLFSPSSTLETFQTAVLELLKCGNKKGWFRESCWWVLLQSIERLEKAGEECSWGVQARTWLLEEVYADRARHPWTVDKMALTIKLQELLPNEDWANLVSPPFKQPQLLSSSNLSVFTRVLKESAPDDDEETPNVAVSIGTWKPQLHFIWDLILDSFSSTAPSTDASSAKAKLKRKAVGEKASLPELFRVVVDEHLFAAASSAERKFWGFQLFEKFLPRLSPSEMPLIFTPNFMRSIINHLSDQDRTLHKAALRAANVIQSVAKENSNVGFTLVSQLVGKNGNQRFDQVTKTKTVEGILASMDAKGVGQYVEYLKNFVCDSEEGEDFDPKLVEARRKWAFDQLLFLVRNANIPKNDEWVIDILDFFALHGFFIIKNVNKKAKGNLATMPKPALSDELRQVCRARILACLSDLTEHATLLKDDDGKTRKVQGVTSTGELWLAKAFSILSKLEQDRKHLTPVMNVDEEALEARKQAVKALGRVRKSSNSDQDRTKAFELLLLSTLVLSWEEPEEALELIEPLIECANRLFPEGGKRTPEPSEDEPSGETVLVDSLIGYLERPSAFARAVATQVFALNSSAMTEESIDHLLDQLGTGPEPEVDEEDDMDVDGEEDEGEQTGDEEDEEDDDDDDGEGDDDEDDDDDEAEVDPELRRRIAEALKVNGIADDGESNSDDDDKDSDGASSVSAMDDDQMMQLDDQLAEIFRSQALAKKERKDAKRENIDFRNKVLDLLDIFAKKQASNPLVVRLVRPLFEIVRDADKLEAQVSAKASALLRSRLFKAKEYPSNAPSEEVASVLQDMHQVARTSQSSELAALSNQSSLYLSKILLSGVDHESSQEANPVLEAYRKSLDDFFDRKNSRLNPNFFAEFIRRFPLHGWHLRLRMLEACSATSTTKVFRQVQAWNLLQVLLTQVQAFSKAGMDEAVLAFIPSVCQTLYAFISHAVSTAESSINVNHLKDTLKFALQAVRITKRLVAVSDERVKEIWDVPALSKLADEVAASEQFKTSASLHGLFRQLLALVDKSANAANKKSPANAGASGNVVTGQKRKGTEEEKGATAHELDEKKLLKKKKELAKSGERDRRKTNASSNRS